MINIFESLSVFSLIEIILYKYITIYKIVIVYEEQGIFNDLFFHHLLFLSISLKIMKWSAKKKTSNEPVLEYYLGSERSFLVS